MAIISLSYIELGSPRGRPIVALHGAGGTGETWRRMATDGLPRRRWICPDLRGHGDSGSAAPWTLQQFAADVVGLMDSLELSETDMIGHSMGAMVAAEVCKQAKSRVDRVILIDPLALMSDEISKFVRNMKSSDKAEQALKDGGRATTFEQAVRHRMKFSPGCGTPVVPVDAWPYALLEEKARLLRNESGELKARSSVPQASGPDLLTNCAPPDLKGYEGNVLLIRARNSGFCTNRALEAMRNHLFEQLSVVTLNSGHEVLWEKYHECVRAVKDFLRFDVMSPQPELSAD